jgi:hypothetical protein
VDLNLGRASYLLDGFSRGYPGVWALSLLGPRPTGGRDKATGVGFDELLVLYLDQPRVLRQVEFCLDISHDYRTVYLARGEERYTEFIRARDPAGSGFAVYRQMLPPATGAVDQIRILLRRGHPPGRVAYWRVIQ